MLKNLKKLVFLATLTGTVLFAAEFSYAKTDMAAFGDQESGRGKGGQDRGRGGEKHDRGDRQGQGKRNEGDRGSQRQQQQWGGENSRRQQHQDNGASRRQQQWSDWNSRRQQQENSRELRRQQQWNDWNSRRQQQDNSRELRRQQQWNDWNSRRQQQNNEREARRQQQQWNDWNSRRQQQIYSDRRRDSDRDYRRGSENRRLVYVSPQSNWFPAWNRGNNYQYNDGRYESQQWQLWKEQRKAERRYARDQQRYAQNNYNQYPSPVYRYYDYDNSYGYYNQSSWKDQILRTLIANVFGGGFGGGNFVPASRYVRTVPQTYGYDQPAYYAPTYYNGYEQPVFESGSLIDSLPIAEFIQQYTGDNEFISELIGNFLSQGYDDGFLAGQYARRHGTRRVAYNDPYEYQNGMCDPYSATLGESRRYLSEGYDLGYRDALNGNTTYDPQTEGNADLVGVLLSNALSGV